MLAACRPYPVGDIKINGVVPCMFVDFVPEGLFSVQHYYIKKKKFSKVFYTHDNLSPMMG